MTDGPSFDDIFAVMSAATHGDSSARVHVPDDSSPDRVPVRFATALNVLLDDLAFREKGALQMAARLRMLADAAREFAVASHDYQQLLEAVARRLSELGGDLCSIRTLTEDGLSFEPNGAVYHPAPAIAAGARALLSTPQRVGEGMTGRVAASGLPLLIAKIAPADFSASSLPEYRNLLSQIGVTSVVAVPLKSRGRVIGVANLLRSDPGRPFNEDDLRLLESVAEHASLAIERVLAEKARRAAEARFARLADSGIIGIVVGSLDGRVVQVNDALADLLGHTRADILAGKVDWRSLTPSEWRSVDERALEELREVGVATLRQKEYFHKDGSRVPVLVGSAMLQGGDQAELIQFVLDLRGRAHLETAIQHLREARASEATFRSFVEAAPDAVLIVNPLGRIVLVNSQAERLFGYSRDELLGQAIEVLVPVRLRERHQGHRSLYCREPRPRSMGLRGLRKDGSEFPVEISLGPIETEAGPLFASAVRDITERKEAEVALARAKDVAESASRELEAFSYSVAHDLRAPLRGMNGFAQILLDQYRDKLDAEGQDSLQEIVLNARKMSALIDALLSLARLTRSTLRREPVDLSGMVQDIGQRLGAAEPDRAVQLEVQPGLAADVDAVLARVLFDNLLGNAWKFTGKVKVPRVAFAAMQQNGTTVFYVRDNGAGFDMAFANKLFAPFQRLHTVDEFPGSGIGLATVQRIVHRHGGKIWTEGKVGEGAAFYFTLPPEQSGVVP